MSAGMGWTAEGELADARKSIWVLRARAELAEASRDRWQKIADGYREGAKEALALNGRLCEAADVLVCIVAEVLRVAEASPDGLTIAACIRDGVPVYTAALARYRALTDPGAR